MRNSVATAGTAIAADFAHAVAAGDRGLLLRMLAPDVELRALTPSRAWAVDSAQEAVDILLGTWFGGGRRIDAVASVETDVVADVVRVGYRFNATTSSGPAVIEQQAYVAVVDGAITALRIICTGYRPVAA